MKTGVLILILGASIARAETPAPPRSTDWTGFYEIATVKTLAAAGFKVMGPNLNALITAHLQPWAKVKMEATDGVADDTGGVCQPDGIFRFPRWRARSSG